MHDFFRPVLRFFVFFTILQFASGAIIFAAKAGLTFSSILEYYRGSEFMLPVFPDATDRFIRAKTLVGLFETHLPHSLAMGLLVFIEGHLIRSLFKENLDNRPIDPFIFAFYVLAGCEIASPYVCSFGPPFLVYARLPILIAFTLCGLLASFLIFRKTFS